MKTFRLLATVFLCLFIIAAPIMAQDLTPSEKAKNAIDQARAERPTGSLTFAGAAVGAALTIIGAGYGFGKIGAAALESMARQPEVAARVQTAMIIIAALLEGATFFALLVCLLARF